MKVCPTSCFLLSVLIFFAPYKPGCMNYLRCPKRKAGAETSSLLQAALLHRWTQHGVKLQRCWSSPQQGEQISIKFKAERAKSEPSPKLAQDYHMRQSGCLCTGALEQFVMPFTQRYEVLLGHSDTECWLIYCVEWKVMQIMKQTLTLIF